MAIIVLIMHKHRFIILRRLALILGLLYGYRAITMFVTNLPKADPNYYCAEKVRRTRYQILYIYHILPNNLQTASPLKQTNRKQNILLLGQKWHYVIRSS